MDTLKVLLIVAAAATLTLGDRYHPVKERLHSKLTKRSVEQDITDGNLNKDWFRMGQDNLMTSLRNMRNMNRAKNVILFVGDGMGVSTVTGARQFNMQVLKKTFEQSQMSFESFPNVAVSKTYNTDQTVPDSAGTATAMLAGVKTRAGTLGVNDKVVRGDCPGTLVDANRLKSILKHSQDEGKWTGVVTTTRITHATPAAAYSYSAERNWEGSTPDGRCKDIARQLVEDEYNKDIRVLLGGGRSNFLPNTTFDPEYVNTTRGRRYDGRDMIQAWLTEKKSRGIADAKYKYVDKMSEFTAIDHNQVDYLMGLFEPSHMQYEADRPEDRWGEPSLAEMVEKAIHILKRNQNGFFLEVEGGRIDHAHHDTNAYRALMDTTAFSDAVQKAVDLTSDQDTLIVVTADHSHVFTIAGYPFWNDNILSAPGMGLDMKPYTTLGYANGPGYSSNKNETTNERIDLRNVNTTTKDYLQDTNVHLRSETHGGEDVLIYARGPLAHLFNGVHEQSYIAHVSMYASCVGPNKDHCKGGQKTPPDCPVSSASRFPVTGYVISLVATLVTIMLNRRR